jgi:hypothetical protein
MSARRSAVILASAVLVISGALSGTSAFADQPPTAPPATNTYTTSAVTDASWTAELSGVTTPAAVECTNPAWTSTITGASWIWAPGADCAVGQPDETVTFSKSLDVTGATVTAAQIQVAVDNSADIYVNGSLAGSVPFGYPAFQDNPPATFDVSSLVTTGSNTITIVATNGPGGGPAGLLAGVSITSSTSLSDKDMCKDGGWQQWTAPVFKNQGDCVSYVVSHSPTSS